MPTTLKKESDPDAIYIDGAQARLCGIKKVDNPYNELHDMYQWDLGWCNAQVLLEKKLSNNEIMYIIENKKG